mmetsp:Transcript_23474/g.39829  ORF Transcript_23474/g.39829 Transcript_23474/m.39829 type:complete len:208 (+) Transcript_23474:625-1248(+)
MPEEATFEGGTESATFTVGDELGLSAGLLLNKSSSLPNKPTATSDFLSEVTSSPSVETIVSLAIGNEFLELCSIDAADSSTSTRGSFWWSDDISTFFLDGAFRVRPFLLLTVALSNVTFTISPGSLLQDRFLVLDSLESEENVLSRDCVNFGGGVIPGMTIFDGSNPDIRFAKAPLIRLLTDGELDGEVTESLSPSLSPLSVTCATA